MAFSYLHSFPVVTAGAGAAVFALGGVEVVADRQLNPLRVHPVGLHDGVAAEIGIGIKVGRTQQVGSFQPQHQRAVLQQVFLDSRT